jgi:2-polyprenyl-6-methoxyphenol hydroxylase-like FAD-dependent oxidoreductase
MNQERDVIIIGGGIGGLVLALSLHQAGVPCRVYEAAPEITALGVGINILPHASRELAELGVLDELVPLAVLTQEAAFFNRFGQLIYREPAGTWAGYDWPQLSIHRGDLQMVLLRAARARIGAGRIFTNHRCIDVETVGDHVVAKFETADGEPLAPVTGSIAVGCDGIHSVLRRKFYPNEGPPKYSGYNMWRGTVVGPPVLTGASMVRAGWLAVGKMVIYPIRNNVDGQGNQLINWLAELQCAEPVKRDWTKKGKVDDFFHAYDDRHYDWLDVSDMILRTENILEYPMVDQDPLPTWTFGRTTLLGDAAHPMYPRGSNGAGQAILDARFLVNRIKERGCTPEALIEYDRERCAATAKVVLANRSVPPDAILREVHERGGDKPFARIEDVISPAELAAITGRYRQTSGSDIEALRRRPAYV